MKYLHRYISLITGAVGVIFILLSEVLSLGPTWLQDFFSNLGTAFLALAILEFLYKTVLQKELLNDVVTQLKLAIAIPIDEIYLRRREMPQVYRLPQAFGKIHEVLYMKAISYNIVLTEGMSTYLPKVLSQNPNLKIKFLVLDPETSLMPAVSNL